MAHIPVLLEEVIAAVPPTVQRMIDCTLGDAGHSQALLEHFPNVELLGLDADPQAVTMAEEVLKRFGKRAHVVHGNFADVLAFARNAQFAPVDFILADLGWSSTQFAERGRGFSFDAPQESLDMRFNPQEGETAADFLNCAHEIKIGDVLRRFGEEKQWREIARAMVKQREHKPFTTVQDLLDTVESVKKRTGRLHPATLVFQALRIQVNHEFERLEQFLKQAPDIVTPGGRLAVISFHSLEDRTVKEVMSSQSAIVKLMTKKPIKPSAQEIKSNPRSRSALMRTFEKI